MPRTRINERIRVREVRVVGVDGKQVGVLETRKAIDMAKRQGLQDRGKAYDLVEISPKARPPTTDALQATLLQRHPHMKLGRQRDLRIAFLSSQQSNDSKRHP